MFDFLLPIAGIIYLLGFATPILAIRLFVRDGADGCMLDTVLFTLAIPVAFLVGRLVFLAIS